MVLSANSDTTVTIAADKVARPKMALKICTVSRSIPPFLPQKTHNERELTRSFGALGGRITW
jgi:hypothetical protein